MKITEVPFSKLIGIKVSDDGDELILPFSDHVKNHLGTFHAGAQFSLMETASGTFLQQQFPELVEKVIPVLRSAEAKYKKPASSDLKAFASVGKKEIERFKQQFEMKGRGIISVSVELIDKQGTVVSNAVYEWFIQTL